MLKLTPAKQTPGHCGPTSLKIVLGYYKIDKSETSLARLSGCAKTKGTSAAGILAAAKSLGLSGFIKDFANFQDLKKYVTEKKIPVIVDWFSLDEGHYSVVAGIDRKNIYLQDPQIGKIRTIELKTFKRIWFDFPGAFLRTKRDIIIRRIIVINKKK